MNAFHRTYHLMAETLAPDWRVITKIFGGLLGPDFIVSTGGKSYRVGSLTVGQLKRGIPAEDLDMLEVDPDTYEAI
ncbi:hypothetical protein EJ076_34965 [Mesorhizobium sp. M7D.F.Ca.US.005.01.1.1]|uniref:hypothetical protein n=1 Tax=Mesorhizobium sp. M7D.F.Ca.US.005.01.1.1 TaxID=2493678 RepID=UPI000F756900|nr:hypothetical protein [Mesorhizobium sp. M7D.F.Ca.US.005.01.1.1]AZO45918.1 hypothetical protein EJ076_34965 [Mesorhizobium sp. M7D.F.Ca.US.005.01.1.1]